MPHMERPSGVGLRPACGLTAFLLRVLYRCAAFEQYSSLPHRTAIPPVIHPSAPATASPPVAVTAGLFQALRIAPRERPPPSIRRVTATVCRPKGENQPNHRRKL